MKFIFILLICISGHTYSDTIFESRNGVTAPHSEGRPIARYLSENTLAFSMESLRIILTGNIYGTQNWRQRVNQEDGMFKTDAVRFEYGAELQYSISNGWFVYTRHISPHDRHDKSVGDGWNDTSYRWDSGLIYKHTFE
jgi:hypothetical protein